MVDRGLFPPCSFDGVLSWSHVAHVEDSPPEREKVGEGILSNGGKYGGSVMLLDFAIKHVVLREIISHQKARTQQFLQTETQKIFKYGKIQKDHRVLTEKMVEVDMSASRMGR